MNVRIGTFIPIEITYYDVFKIPTLDIDTAYKLFDVHSIRRRDLVLKILIRALDIIEAHPNHIIRSSLYNLICKYSLKVDYHIARIIDKHTDSEQLHKKRIIIRIYNNAISDMNALFYALELFPLEIDLLQNVYKGICNYYKYIDEDILFRFLRRVHRQDLYITPEFIPFLIQVGNEFAATLCLKNFGARKFYEIQWLNSAYNVVKNNFITPAAIEYIARILNSQAELYIQTRKIKVFNYGYFFESGLFDLVWKRRNLYDTIIVKALCILYGNVAFKLIPHEEILSRFMDTANSCTYGIIFTYAILCNDNFKHFVLNSLNIDNIVSHYKIYYMNACATCIQQKEWVLGEAIIECMQELLLKRVYQKRYI